MANLSEEIPRLEQSPRFIGADLYNQAAFGLNHPLSYTRISSVMNVCKWMDWLQPSDLIAAQIASEDVLGEFHDPGYIAALKQASAAGAVTQDVRQQYNFGNMENPVFRGVFERASMTVGGSILAAQAALDGYVAYHPAGGTHHGKKDRASGFCYFNDPVFAVQTFLEQNLRVLYVDLDAHYGDGVALAFEQEPRVSCLSVHEENKWPYSGALQDSNATNFNIPVAKGFNDAEFEALKSDVLLPIIAKIQPDAVVIVAGADCLAGDPLSNMELHNRTLWKAIIDIANLVPRAVILGGGGYNPWVTVRYWSGLWAALTGQRVGRPTTRVKNLLAQFDSDLVDEEDRPSAWLTEISDEVPPVKMRPEFLAYTRKLRGLFEL